MHQPESGVRKPESTIIVQAGIELSDHGRSQDQENEHHRRFYHGSRGNGKAVSVTMAPGGPQGCSNQRNDKLSTSECAEGCWRSRRLEALVSTGTAWEHLLQRGACRKWVSSVLSCLAAATQSWTYRLSRRMSSCGWMEQQWLKIGCCHGRLFIVAWGMTLRWTMLTTYCAFWQPPACRKECHSCTRRKTQPLVSEVAPEGSLQGFQIPYIEGRQPGALNSKRAMQPLLATGLGKRGSIPMWHTNG